MQLEINPVANFAADVIGMRVVAYVDVAGDAACGLSRIDGDHMIGKPRPRVRVQIVRTTEKFIAGQVVQLDPSDAHFGVVAGFCRLLDAADAKRIGEHELFCRR